MCAQEFASAAQFKDVWEDHIKDCMGANYSLVKSAHMGQIRLLLFARNDIYAAITRVERGVQVRRLIGGEGGSTVKTARTQRPNIATRRKEMGLGGNTASLTANMI